MAPVNMRSAGAKVVVTIAGVGTAKSREIMNLREELVAKGESLSISEQRMSSAVRLGDYLL